MFAAAAAASCAGMLTSWAELMQLLLQQRQRQLSAGRTVDCQALQSIFSIVRVLPNMWMVAMLHVPSEAPSMAQAALPLLQQLQAYGRQISPGAAAASAGSSCDGLWVEYNHMQLEYGGFIHQL